MTKTAVSTDNNQPYRPSWINRGNAWVDRLPVHPWIFFAALGLVLIAAQGLLLLLLGGGQPTGLMPVIVFNSLFTPFLLALIQFLDKQAGRALNMMRPVLNMSETQFQEYHYRLATIPFPAGLVSGLVMVSLAFAMEWLGMVPTSYAALEQLPLFNLVFQVIDKSSAFLFGVFFYHTIRQLRLVQVINRQYVRINLFNQGPIQGFSRLTASTAIGLVIGVYGWLLINPELLSDPLIIVFVVVITLLALTVFVWPLYGMHQRLEAEKRALLQEIDQRFDTVFARFNAGFEQEDYAALEQLNGTIASLETQNKRIRAVLTWPWQPETAQFTLSAVTIPLILAILQFLVELAINT